MPLYEKLNWKEIPGYEGYYASTTGLIKRPNGKVTAGSLSGNGYLLLSINSEKVYVHRLLALTFLENSENKAQVNHINRVRTDNRLENIEWNTVSENMRNLSKKANTSSKFMGVTWYKRCAKWMSQIYLDEKQKCLGYFENELDAARAYDQIARQNGFKHLNFPTAND